MNYNKHTALRLEWSEVGHIASRAIADIIGRSITCVGKRDDETYWEIQFVDYQMPLSEKFKILERIGVTKELQREYESTIATSLFMEASKKLLRYALKIATVYKGNIIKNLIMDCQSYTKYRPNETTGGIFVSWQRKEELPTGA